MSFYDIYNDQYGGGGRGVNSVFVGSYNQRGHGLGSFFTGLFRSALPFITKGARAVGKEALRAGVNIIDDVAENHISFKDSLKNRVNESGNILRRKATDKIIKMMEGSGYNALPYKRRKQSRRVGRRRRISSVKKLSVRKKRSRVSRRGGVRKIRTKRKRKTRKNIRKKRVHRRKNKKSKDIFN